MTKSVSITGVKKIDPRDYKGFFLLDVEVDDVPTGMLVGLIETEIGIDVLSGSDILRFVDEKSDVHALIGKAISEHK